MDEENYSRLFVRNLRGYFPSPYFPFVLALLLLLKNRISISNQNEVNTRFHSVSQKIRIHPLCSSYINT